MTDEYRVAKKEVMAEVTVAGEKPAVLTLFLAGRTRQHAGDERPSDLLNGPDIFLPAIDRKKKLRLLQRDAVVVITVLAEYEPVTEDRKATLTIESKGVIAQTLCRKKGGGRVAALEILLVTSAVSNLIREGKTFQIPSVMQTGRGAGMMTLSDSLLDLVKKGLVEPDEAYSCAVNKQELRSMLERSGVKLAAA